MTQPLRVPSGAHLHGMGWEVTTVRSRIPATPRSGTSALQWPYRPPQTPGLVLEPVMSVIAGISTSDHAWKDVILSNFSIDASFSASQRIWSNTHCGAGLGSDAFQPGSAACGWNRGGIAVFSEAGSANQATGITFIGLRIANASRGIDIAAARGLLIDNCTVQDSGYGPLVQSRVVMISGAKFSKSSFEGSLGSGLSIWDGCNITISDCHFRDNTWDGLRVNNSSAVTLQDVDAEFNMKCGVRITQVTGFSIRGGSITHNPTVDQGGLCISDSKDGTVRDTVVDGNGVNFAGASSLENVSFADIECDVALYSAWSGCDPPGCVASNVSCSNGHRHSPAASMSPGPYQAQKSHDNTYPYPPLPQVADDGDPVLLAPGRSAAAAATWTVFRPARPLAKACTIAPGQDIQQAIDAAAVGTAATICHLLAGVHEVTKPIVVPSNMAIVGAGSDLTLVRSRMLESSLMMATCGFKGGNCAVFTVRHVSSDLNSQ